MSAELKQAYALIFEFKSGALGSGDMTAEQGHLIELLKDDLNVQTPETDIAKLAKLVAIADSYWNQQTQMTISKYYGALAKSSPGEAQGIREAFFGQCPSVWYREIVSNL